MNVKDQCGQKNLKLTATPCGQMYNYSIAVVIAPVTKPVTKGTSFKMSIFVLIHCTGNKYLYPTRGKYFNNHTNTGEQIENRDVTQSEVIIYCKRRNSDDCVQLKGYFAGMGGIKREMGQSELASFTRS